MVRPVRAIWVRNARNSAIRAAAVIAKDASMRGVSCTRGKARNERKPTMKRAGSHFAGKNSRETVFARAGMNFLNLLRYVSRGTETSLYAKYRTAQVR